MGARWQVDPAVARWERAWQDEFARIAELVAPTDEELDEELRQLHFDSCVWPEVEALVALAARPLDLADPALVASAAPRRRRARRRRPLFCVFPERRACFDRDGALVASGYQSIVDYLTGRRRGG